MRLLIASIAIVCFASCTGNRIKEKEDWGKVYQQFGIDSAGAEILEQSKERVFYYNKYWGKRRTAAAGTYNLMLSLIALETGVAPSEDMVIQYNGPANTDTLLTKSMSLKEAFAANNAYYFTTLAAKIGATTIKKWTDTLRYGSTAIDTANWDYTKLQVSLDEQVGLVKRLYFSDLPFSDRTERIARTLLFKQEAAGKFKSYYQISSNNDATTNKSWMIGFLEDSTNHPYIFASQIESKNKAQNLDSINLVAMRSIFNTMQLWVK